MPTLRDILDGKDLFAASPLATHVGKHIQDPAGATKDDFADLQKAKLDYDMQREKTQRNLAPVQSVITHLSNMHGLDPNMMVTPTPAMGQGDPNNPQANSMNPMNPDDEELDEFGNPKNMQQVPGQMNMNRPTMVGHQPGVSPMMEKQVVPPKLGMASPGKPTARNSPAPNPQQDTFNKQAKPPKGNKSLPNAKGPGDPYVANRSKKAFGKSQGTKNELNDRRPVKVTVHASASTLRTVGIGESLGLASLKFRAEMYAGSSMPIGPGGALGPSGVMPGNVPKTGQPIQARKRVKALDELSDKEPGDTAHQETINPVTTGMGNKLDAKGHSFGAKKGWSTRGKGHLSANEKSAHHATLDFCSKCGKIHAEGKCMNARSVSTHERKSLAKKGEALPGGGFPIANRSDLANAKQAIGRAKNPAATRAFINRRAKQLHAPAIGQ